MDIRSAVDRFLDQDTRFLPSESPVPEGISAEDFWAAAGWQQVNGGFQLRIDRSTLQDR